MYDTYFLHIIFYVHVYMKIIIVACQGVLRNVLLSLVLTLCTLLAIMLLLLNLLRISLVVALFLLVILCFVDVFSLVLVMSLCLLGLVFLFSCWIIRVFHLFDCFVDCLIANHLACYWYLILISLIILENHLRLYLVFVIFGSLNSCLFFIALCKLVFLNLLRLYLVPCFLNLFFISLNQYFIVWNGLCTEFKS